MPVLHQLEDERRGAFPIPGAGEISEDVAEAVRLKRPFQRRTKALLGRLRISIFRGDIHKAKTVELSEQWLVGE